MISLYFGLPGCGKTTLLTKFALKEVKKKNINVYCNIDIKVNGVIRVYNHEIGKYDISYGTLLIDEGTLFSDCRNYKSFSNELVEFFLTHRHDHLNIIIFTQGWDTLDKRIRIITDRVYYVYKPFPLGIVMTRYYRIPYGIIIPDPKKEDSEKLGEIIQGYCKPGFFRRLFSGYCYRPKYYKYFDSWERKERPPLPDLESRIVV